MLTRHTASLWTIRRTLSTVSSTNPVYISASNSPYFNLSLEDWLFRNAPPDIPLLLVYRNDPCVVIGRNQNPWKEINFRALHALNVPFIRRRSGGGTVYHIFDKQDLGNTNFSIHVPRTSFDRHHTAQIVQRALHTLGVDADVNERNDICVGGFKHVSGSAYKLVQTRAYHHGTMLFSTELANLGDALRNTKDGLVTKGVASVRSPVHNIQQFNPDVTHSSFVDSLIAQFSQEYNLRVKQVQNIQEDDVTSNIGHIKNGINELQQWEWKFGQTPEFTHRLDREFDWGNITASIKSKHGLIISCSLASSSTTQQAWCDRLAQSLVGHRYASLEGFSQEDNGKFDSHQGREKEVINWLREDM